MSTAAVACENCGTEFEVRTEYFQVFGSDPYCEDCLVHTRCQSCGRGLRLRSSRYRELGGEPVACAECGETARTPQTAGRSNRASSSTGGLLAGTFWEGLTLGEKVAFPVLGLALVAIVGYLLLASSQGQDVDAGIVPVGLLILLGWTYRRGKRNRSGS